MTLIDDDAPALEHPSPAPDVRTVLAGACARLAPAWPLDRVVAVNPYVGLVDHTFEAAAARLARVAGARATPPVAVHLAEHDAGAITEADLAGALRAAGRNESPAAFVARLRAGADQPVAPSRIPTVARVATEHGRDDVVALLVERVGAWAAAYFDEGQAMWHSADRTGGLFRSWRAEAAIDRTPEILGLRGFRRTARSLPDDAIAAAGVALDELDVPEHQREHYLHALLLTVGGWASYASHLVFERNRDGHEDDTCVQLLAVLLCWELAILRARRAQGLDAAWHDAWRAVDTAGDDAFASGQADALVLHDAAERAARRRLHASFAPQDPAGAPATRPAAQGVFCIDVRSEVLRRHLEAAHGDIETIGFAGFFGFPLAVVPLDHDHAEPQCPVLLSPTNVVAEVAGDAAATEAAVAARSRAHHVGRSWKSFKMGAVSCFSFVGPVGLAYLPKLFRDGWGRTRPVPHPGTEGLPGAARAALAPTVEAAPTHAGLTTGIPLERRVELAAGALRGMSLAHRLAPLVLLAGHGATSVNNPFDAALACGACGGRSGDVNARIAASVLNDPEVRTRLAATGIAIPSDTWFVAGLHDTTTDVVHLLDTDAVPASHHGALDALRRALAQAGAATREERAARLGITAADPHAAVVRRSADWAQVRPEWGLAGCRAFVAAPRSRTAGIDLEGRVFLHSYDWRQDPDFSVLELIINAPMVVASWINLQYYASSVEDRLFGAGDKTLHNVVGRIGVVEGNGGDLRVGLPKQSVHDGTALRHEPLRLDVVIEAPIDAITDVLARHEHPRLLCDNRWIHLSAMGDDGTVTHHYAGGLRWEPVG